jgi:hypothetical protein
MNATLRVAPVMLLGLTLLPVGAAPVSHSPEQAGTMGISS